MNIKFTSELEAIFRDSFLAAAPLYREAGKVKLPFEDAKKITTLYRGSLTDETRQVETIADYTLFKDGYPGDDAIRHEVDKLGSRAGVAIDGLIRLENVRNATSQDPRDVSSLKVTDIFNHADGRRNFQIMLVKEPSNWFAPEPAAVPPSWISYRFYFAAASIRMEYKK